MALGSFKRKIKNALGREDYDLWPKTRYNSVEVVYWRPPVGVNFGDELSKIITLQMLSRKGMTPLDEVECPKRLLTIGSIMHYAREGDVVWGTGVNGSNHPRKYEFRELDVRAVRGPLTAKFLREKNINVPEVYGDPGLLLKELSADRFRRTSEYRVCFVPNLNDGVHNTASIGNIPIVSPLQSWNSVVSEILRYDFVLASSLHALIVADAFDIPSRYVRISGAEGLFKYNDYYLGSGRREVEVYTSLEDAYRSGGCPRPVVDLDALKEAFPYDLWEARIR